MDVIAGPLVERRPARHAVGIRTVTPFKGMLGRRDELLEELLRWLEQRQVPAGSMFFRLHVIDMRGPMDIEVGATLSGAVAGDDRVRPGMLPAGDYVTLTYRDHSLRANGMLLDWAATNLIELDRAQGPAGDHFACRYELYRTDIRAERRKTRWTVQLNILARPQGGTAQGAGYG